MIKCKIVSMVTLLFMCQQITPLGGGVFLYRYNQGDLEFLFALDPAHISQTDKFGKTKSWWSAHRVGFEYPAGAFDTTDNAISDQPHTFVHGAVREMLEELVFVPAQLLNASLNPYNMPTNPLNKSTENQCIDIFEKAIIQKGIFFIYKPKVKGHTSTPNDQTAVFFFNITDKCPSNLPEKIINQRINLAKNGFTLTGRHLNSIHAESIAIAWVKAQDILKILNNPQNTWVPFSQLAEHNETNNSLQLANITDHAAVINHQTKTIRISTACMGMMQNRETDEYNPQQNIAVIKKPTETVYFNATSNSFLSTPPPAQSSSMQAVIKYLQSQAKISAPPPPAPAPKSTFDVNAHIKKHTNTWKTIIENEITDINSPFPEEQTVTGWILTPAPLVGSVESDIQAIKAHIKTLFDVHKQNLKKNQKPTQPAKKIVHPNANQLLTQALELAALLPRS